MNRRPLKRKTPLKQQSDRRRSESDDRADVREQVYRRDYWTCRLERASRQRDDVPECSGPLTPHHLKKASAGGPYTLENLVTLCRGHNSWVEDAPLLATELGMVIR
jgi:5-methylcytosine-specific restriction endonuclease McrA